MTFSVKWKLPIFFVKTKNHSLICTLWKFRNFTAKILCQKFRQINVWLDIEELYTKLISRKNWCGSEFHVFPHSQCVNYGNLLSHYFGKNFVKATHLPKKFIDHYKELIWREKNWWGKHFAALLFLHKKGSRFVRIQYKYLESLRVCSDLFADLWKY